MGQLMSLIKDLYEYSPLIRDMCRDKSDILKVGRNNN